MRDRSPAAALVHFKTSPDNTPYPRAHPLHIQNIRFEEIPFVIPTLVVGDYIFYSYLPSDVTELHLHHWPTGTEVKVRNSPV